MPSKTIKNRYEIRLFLQKLHICIWEHCVQNVFSSIFKGLNKIHFSSDTRNITQCVWQAQKTNTPFRVSHRFYIKNDIRTTIPRVTFFEKKDQINATTLQGQPMKYKHFDDITTNYKTDFILLYFTSSSANIPNGCFVEK